MESTPPGVCSDWQVALVKLPNGTLHNQTRFPLYGARKVWSVCPSPVLELRVTLSDLPAPPTPGLTSAEPVIAFSPAELQTK